MNAVENTRAYEAMKYDFNESELVGLQYKPHPISLLIKERFSDEYDGKLTWREINEIKQKMDKSENDMNNYKNEVFYEMNERRKTIREHLLCEKELDYHLKECHSELSEMSDEKLSWGQMPESLMGKIGGLLENSDLYNLSVTSKDNIQILGLAKKDIFLSKDLSIQYIKNSGVNDCRKKIDVVL